MTSRASGNHHILHHRLFVRGVDGGRVSSHHDEQPSSLEEGRSLSPMEEFERMLEHYEREREREQEARERGEGSAGDDGPPIPCNPLAAPPDAASGAPADLEDSAGEQRDFVPPSHPHLLPRRSTAATPTPSPTRCWRP